MGWLLKLAARLATLRKLKARRTELFLELSYVPQWERQTLSTFGDGKEFARIGELKHGLRRELNVVNDEIARRGK